MERIKEDRPITIKDDKGNLNRCIADVVSVCPHSSWEGPVGTRGKGLLAWVNHKSIFRGFLELSSKYLGRITLAVRGRSIDGAQGPPD